MYPLLDSSGYSSSSLCSYIFSFSSMISWVLSSIFVFDIACDIRKYQTVYVSKIVSVILLEGKSVNLVTEALLLSAFFMEVIIEGWGRKKMTYQPSGLWCRSFGSLLSPFNVHRIIWESVHVDSDSVRLGSWVKPPSDTDVASAWTMSWVARLYVSHDKGFGFIIRYTLFDPDSSRATHCLVTGYERFSYSIGFHNIPRNLITTWKQNITLLLC